jgi:hypothetical protein
LNWRTKNDTNRCIIAWHTSRKRPWPAFQRHPSQGQRSGRKHSWRKNSRQPNAEDVSNLRQLQFEHEERLLELGIEKAKMELAEMELFAKAAQSDADNITDRWEADMSSDSWLSKNIRPMSLIAIFCGYFCLP